MSRLHRRRCRRKVEPPSMTQVELEQLRGDIEDLTDDLDLKKPSKAVKSQNVLEIERLRGGGTYAAQEDRGPGSLYWKFGK